MSEQLSPKAPEILTVNKESSVSELENLVNLRTSQLQEAKIALAFLKAQRSEDETLPLDFVEHEQSITLNANSIDYVSRDFKIQQLLIENDYLNDKINKLEANRPHNHDGVRGLKTLTDQEDAEIMLLDFENATLKNEIARLNDALLDGRPETILRKLGKFLLTR